MADGGARTRWAARSGIALTVTAVAVSLSVGSAPDSPLGPSSAAATGTLDPFADCDEVAAWYAERALPEVTAWGLGAGWGYAYMRTEGTIALDAAAPGSEVPTVGNRPTGTNVQEAGVDEPDTAKIMGDHVVSLEGHDLVVTDVSAGRTGWRATQLRPSMTRDGSRSIHSSRCLSTKSA